MTSETPQSLNSIEKDIADLRHLAGRMDAIFTIPGTRINVGLDSILGLVPGIGDTLALAPSLYIVWKSHRLGATPGTLARMGGNVAIDWAVGLVPLLGDLFDAAFNANLRNVDLLEKSLATQATRARDVTLG